MIVRKELNEIAEIKELRREEMKRESGGGGRESVIGAAKPDGGIYIKTIGTNQGTSIGQ